MKVLVGAFYKVKALLSAVQVLYSPLNIHCQTSLTCLIYTISTQYLPYLHLYPPSVRLIIVVPLDSVTDFHIHRLLDNIFQCLVLLVGLDDLIALRNIDRNGVTRTLYSYLQFLTRTKNYILLMVNFKHFYFDALNKSMLLSIDREIIFFSRNFPVHII